MDTNIVVQHWLNANQIQALEDNPKEGKAPSVMWWMRNLTKGEFVNYDKMLGIQRVKGDTKFDYTFKEGTFEAGTELQVGVGDYNVKDERGFGCSQKAYFYINEDGSATPCKWAELPSQNGGIVPPKPEPVQSEITVQVPQAQPESKPQKTEEDISSYLLYTPSVVCTANEDVMGAYDFCSMFEPSPEAEGGERACILCVKRKELYVKRE